MRIYLAARYSRREELCKYRAQLQSLGYAVQARWLDGKHQIDNVGKPIGDDGEALIEGDGDESTNVRNAELRPKFALDDYQDKSHHPDVGGDPEKFREVQAAYDAWQTTHTQ